MHIQLHIYVYVHVNGCTYNLSIWLLTLGVLITPKIIFYKACFGHSDQSANVPPQKTDGLIRQCTSVGLYMYICVLIYTLYIWAISYNSSILSKN